MRTFCDIVIILVKNIIMPTKMSEGMTELRISNIPKCKKAALKKIAEKKGVTLSGYVKTVLSKELSQSNQP